MSATPCPGSPGCKCPYCYGMHEYMRAATGADYGLPVTYQPWTREEPKPAPVVVLAPRVVRQPWEPRPSRRLAA